MKKSLLIVILTLTSFFGAFAQPSVLSEDFEAVFPPAGWANLRTGSSNFWIDGVISGAGGPHGGTYFAQYYYNATNAANAFLISKAVALTAGSTYTISYWVRTGGFPENLKITVGTAQTIAAQTTVLQTLPSMTNTAYVQQTTTFVAPSTTNYYFGWNCYSAADQFYLDLDDINITCSSCPYLSVNPSALGIFSSTSGVPSFQQSYDVIRGNLTSNTTITAPAGFEISLTGGGGFVSSSPIVLAPTSGVATTTIYVRSNSASSTTFTGSISNVSPGVTTQNVSVSGNNTPCVSATNTITFTGAGTFNWNTPAAWSLSHVPLPCEDVIINYNESTGGADQRNVVIDIPATIKSLTINNDPVGNGNKALLVYNNFPLIVNGNVSIASKNGNQRASEAFLGSNNSSILINGNLTIGGTAATQNTSSFGNYAGTPNITIRGDITFNTRGYMFSGGNYILDGSTTQTITTNSTLFTNGMGFQNLQIGNSNNANVTIAGGTTYPLYVSGGNLTINPGSTLTIPSTYRLNQYVAASGNLLLKSNSNLKLGGTTGGITGSNFPSNFASYTLDSLSTVEFNGAAQTVPGTTQLVNSYGNLTLTSNTKTLGSEISIFRNLTLGGTTNLTLGNFNVNLKSNNKTTASVAALPTGAVFTYGGAGTGRFVVERFINSGGTHGKSWQLLATPVQSDALFTVKNTWMENGTTPAGLGIWLTSPFYPATGGFDAYTQGHSIKVFNSSTNVYDGLTSTALPITNSKGYYVFVRGDRSVTPVSGTVNNTTLRSKGKIYDLAAAPPSVAVLAGKFQSVGNPYPSAITFSTLRGLATTPSDIANQYTAWDPSLNGTYGVGGYQTFTNATGFKASAGGSAIYTAAGFYPTIQSGQAFFVKSIASANNINFTEAVKVGGSILVTRTGTYSSADDRPMLFTRLFTSTGAIADGNIVAFDDQFSNAVDAEDGSKILNGGENFGLKRSGVTLAVEARGGLQATDTLQYEMSNLREQTYQLVLVPRFLATEPLTGYFVDKFLNTSTPISLSDSTILPITVTANPASKAADRFMVVFKQLAGPLPVTITSVSATRNNDRSIAVKWKVENEINIQSYDVQRSADGISFTGIISANPTTGSGLTKDYLRNDISPLSADNFYRIKATSIGGQIQYSAVVKVAPEKAKPSIRVYPNPVVDNTVQLYFTNQTAGKYSVQISNTLGQQVYNGTAQVSGSGYVQSITLNNSITKGNYTIKVVSEGGDISTQQLIIQ